MLNRQSPFCDEPTTFDTECTEVLQTAEQELLKTQEKLQDFLQNTDVARAINLVKRRINAARRELEAAISERAVVVRLTRMAEAMDELVQIEKEKLKRTYTPNCETTSHVEALKGNFGYYLPEECEHTTLAEEGLAALETAANNLSSINGADISVEERDRALQLLEAMTRRLTTIHATYSSKEHKPHQTR